MAKLEKSIFVQAPVEEVSAFLTEPANWPMIWPSMLECQGTQHSPDGSHYTAVHWVYKMSGMRFEGDSDTIEYTANQRITTKSRSGIENTVTWAFAPEGGGTRATFSVEYVVPVPVLGKLAENAIVRANEQEMDVVLANLKATLETES
jgi:carbon monoxide dehydrogenase subunit G